MKIGTILSLLIVTVLCTLNQAASQTLSADSNSFVPGEVLIKFKETSELKAKIDSYMSARNVLMKAGKKGTVDQVSSISGRSGILGIKSVDDKLETDGVKTLYRAFNNYDPSKFPSASIIRGKTIHLPDLSTVLVAHFDSSADVREVVKSLSEDPNIEYAEPNYIVRLSDNGLATVKETDPDSIYQYYLHSVGIDSAWTLTTGDTSIIVGIIDTGIDTTHSDLIGKLWNNPNVNPDSDDVHGWNFLFGGSNDIWDDNGHGTHVAGILGAETENGIGISGVVPECRLMILKAFQSNGTGNVVDISNAILYAINHGASVINMSFGTYAHPTVMEQTLEVAYASAILVAAAGNDGLSLEAPDFRPFFPAALNYVIGVQADDQQGKLALFSNYDPSGPFVSNNMQQLNYEVQAPGVNIFSTLPISQYGYMTGTSMATPIITGIACLLTSLHPDWSNDQTFVQLVNGCNPPLNAYRALSLTYPPRLALTSYSTIDTLDGNRNGLPDAGETIQMPFTIQNLGSQADSIYVSLKLDSLEDQSLIKMQDSVEFFGSLAPRGSRSNTTHPFVFKIDSNVQNGRSVHLDYTISCKELPSPVTGSFYIIILHGIDLNGLVTSNMTLTPDKSYLVTGNLLVTNNATLTIMPGTTIKLQAGATIAASGGKIIAVGTSSQKITFTSSNPPQYWGSISIAGTSSEFTYCIFEYGGVSSAGSFLISSLSEPFEHCEFRFCNFGGPMNDLSHLINFQYCLIHDNSSSGGLLADLPNQIFTHNTIVDNVCWGAVWYIDFNNVGFPNSTHGFNNVFDNISQYQAVASAGTGLFQAPLNYWGTSDSASVHNEFQDFTVDASKRFALVRPFLLHPDSAAPPVVDSVWLSPVAPVGAGVETLMVKFGKPMDTTQHPQVSFGVAPPFTQHFVVNGAWMDSSTWSGSYTFSLATGDGEYTIRVANAAAPDGFSVPEEKQRFEFVVAVAGGASSQLAASLDTTGVKLYWTRTKAPDIGGYIVYRALQVNDTTTIDTVQASASLLRDTTYVDNRVNNGNTYWYMLATLNSDMNEIIRTKPFKIYVTGIMNAVKSGLSSFSFHSISDTIKYATDTVKIAYTAATDTAKVQLIYGIHVKGQSSNDLDTLITTVDTTVSLLASRLRPNGTYIVSGWVTDKTDTTLSADSLKFHTGQLTDIGAISNIIPKNFELYQNYPNPFNPSTIIRYDIPKASHVIITLYDVLGQKVADLVNQMRNPGQFSVTFNGSRFASGIYFCRIEAGAFVQVKKMVLLK